MGQWGQDLGLKMTISNHKNCLKVDFLIFFFTIFQTFSTQCTQKPVEMNFPIKVPYGGTRSTLLGQWKQVLVLEMDKSYNEFFQFQ